MLAHQSDTAARIGGANTAEPVVRRALDGVIAARAYGEIRPAAPVHPNAALAVVPSLPEDARRTAPLINQLDITPGVNRAIGAFEPQVMLAPGANCGEVALAFVA
jgi:hypothetical protein